jgi:hypothetical protein
MAKVVQFVRLDNTFDPEAVEMLSAALEIAWARIEKSNSVFARPAYVRAMREVVARHIVEIAKQGVRDPQRLAEDAVSFVAASYRARDPINALHGRSAGSAASNANCGAVPSSRPPSAT